MEPWQDLFGTTPPRQPAPVKDEAVHDLIRRADDHELGRSFLLRGAQDSVAATFGVHAFVVDAARDRLSDGAPGA